MHTQDSIIDIGSLGSTPRMFEREDSELQGGNPAYSLCGRIYNQRHLSFIAITTAATVTFLVLYIVTKESYYAYTAIGIALITNCYAMYVAGYYPKLIEIRTNYIKLHGQLVRQQKRTEDQKMLTSEEEKEATNLLIQNESMEKLIRSQKLEIGRLQSETQKQGNDLDMLTAIAQGYLKQIQALKANQPEESTNSLDLSSNEQSEDATEKKEEQTHTKDETVVEKEKTKIEDSNTQN